VDIVHKEYILKSYLINQDWLKVVCATGPGVLTASAIEVILQQPNVSYRLLSGRMMRSIGARNSMPIYRGNITNYYRLMSGRKREKLLAEYSSEK